MYIGPKHVENIQEKDGVVIVSYEDKTVETLSKRMYDATVSDEACDLTALRDKRMEPVAREVLGLLRDWGIKVGEIRYLSVLLDTSLSENEKAANVKLWQAWLPGLQNPDDIDLISIDAVLKKNA